VLVHERLVIWSHAPQTMATSAHRRPAMRDPSRVTWRHVEADILLHAIRGSLREASNEHEVEALMHDCGVSVDHTTVVRGIQRDAPERENRSVVAR
jgi:transposase-like protein